MEFLSENYVNTTTQFLVNDGTATVSNIFNPNFRFQFASANFANDLTTVTMRINFDETMTIDRIAICEHNLKDFTLFYNGATANTFVLTNTGDTIASSYSSNSATAHFFRTTQIYATSVSIDMKKTITANQNKAIGYLAISKKRTDFNNRNPSAQGYQLKRNPMQIKHVMSNGGVRLQTLEDKYESNISFEYLTEAVKNELKEIYDNHEEIIFCPFGTTTGWDSVIFPCVWSGDFNFFNYSDNASDAGFSGSINLLETP